MEPNIQEVANRIKWLREDLGLSQQDMAEATERSLEEYEQDKPIHLSRHEGQEIDYVLEGRMRFAFEDHEEVLDPGDMVMYDSGRPHGMIAIDGAPCRFLAIVLRPSGPTII